MYLKIKTIEKIKDQYGFFIAVKKIGLYDKDGKWIRWVKLNDELIKLLLNSKITI
jgi:hypothetical protein